jgi:hypothetical protein
MAEAVHENVGICTQGVSYPPWDHALPGLSIDVAPSLCPSLCRRKGFVRRCEIPSAGRRSLLLPPRVRIFARCASRSEIQPARGRGLVAKAGAAEVDRAGADQVSEAPTVIFILVEPVAPAWRDAEADRGGFVLEAFGLIVIGIVLEALIL